MNSRPEVQGLQIGGTRRPSFWRMSCRFA